MESHFKRQRLMLDKTQKEVADDAGVTVSSVCLWEQRKRVPSLAHLIKWAEAVKTPFHDYRSAVYARHEMRGGR